MDNDLYEEKRHFETEEEQMHYEMEQFYWTYKKITEPDPISLETFEYNKDFDLNEFTSSKSLSLEAFYVFDARGPLVQWYAKTPEGCFSFVDKRTLSADDLIHKCARSTENTELKLKRKSKNKSVGNIARRRPGF